MCIRDSRTVVGHVLHHNGVASDAYVVTNMDIAQNLGTRSHGDIVAKRGVALAALVARASQGDALVQDAVVADNGRLAYHDAHGMIDEETPPKLSGGMNLDAGEKPRDLRKEMCIRDSYGLGMTCGDMFVRAGNVKFLAAGNGI